VRWKLKTSACSGSLLAVMVAGLPSLLTMCDINKWEELYSRVVCLSSTFSCSVLFELWTYLRFHVHYVWWWWTITVRV
jgi:hypothetical protein